MSNLDLDDYLSRIGEQVSKLRKARGLSQMALAAEAGVDKTYIGLLERAEVNPTIGTMLKVADALGVELTVNFRQQRKSSR